MGAVRADAADPGRQVHHAGGAVLPNKTHSSSWIEQVQFAGAGREDLGTALAELRHHVTAQEAVAACDPDLPAPQGASSWPAFRSTSSFSAIRRSQSTIMRARVATSVLGSHPSSFWALPGSPSR